MLKRLNTFARTCSFLAVFLTCSACATTGTPTLGDIEKAWNVNRDRALRLYCALSPDDRDAALKALRLKDFLGDRASVVCPAPGVVGAGPYISEG